MAEKEYLDYLYKVLRKNDIYNLSFFDDATLSDDEYFLRAIKNDVISNASLIVVNILAKNLRSVGVDNNCRAIIESLAILKMDKTGQISTQQKKNFRNQYIIVDFDNYKKTLKENTNFHAVSDFSNKYKNAIEELKSFYNCTESQLKKNYVRDPNFYLKKSLNDKVSSFNLISKNEPFENATNIYSFFSLFCHPFYEHIEAAEQSIFELKCAYLNLILNQIEIFIKEYNLDTDIKKQNGFDEDYTNNQILENNHILFRYIDFFFDDLQKQFCDFKELGYDRFTIYFYDFLRYLFKDIQISLSLGYKESVISKYKSFLEMASINCFLNSANDEIEMRKLKTCFWISSGIQLNQVLKKSGNYDEEYKRLLTDVYENYYKEKYGCNSLDEFLANIKKNSLYFASKEEKSYKNLVRNMLDNIFKFKGLEHLRQEAFITYEIANDINHAGGYSFNCNTGLIDLTPYTVVRIICDYLLYVLPLRVIAVSKHKEGIDINKHLKAIVELREKIVDKIKTINESYLESYKEEMRNKA